MPQDLKLHKIRHAIKRIQQELIVEIQKFDNENYYGKPALKGCQEIERLTNQLILATVELTLEMEDYVEN